MLKLKSAQGYLPDLRQQDFLDPRVTHILRLIGEEQFKCQQKLQTIEELNSTFDDLKVPGRPQIGVRDLQKNVELWEKIRSVIGDLDGI